MKNTVFKGMATALITPMTPTGVDYDALARLIEFQIESGINGFDEIENYLLQNSINGDLLITMGAGDIVKVGERLLGK